MPARKESRSRAPCPGWPNWRAWLLRKLDALRRVRVAGEEVEAGVGGAADRAEIRVGRHGLQEATRRIGVETSLAAGLDADGVGLQLLVARELREPQLAADQRHVGAGVLAEHVGHHLGGEHFLGFLCWRCRPWLAVTWPISWATTAASSAESLARARSPRVT